MDSHLPGNYLPPELANPIQSDVYATLISYVNYSLFMVKHEIGHIQSESLFILVVVPVGQSLRQLYTACSTATKFFSFLL